MQFNYDKFKHTAGIVALACVAPAASCVPPIIGRSDVYNASTGYIDG